MRVALVSCVKSKLDHPSEAKDLYTSPLFKKLRSYAEANADRWYILSAEHGLLRPDLRIAPYEKTLNKMRASERKRWARKVTMQFEECIPPDAEVVMLAGERYRESLIPWLLERGNAVQIPLKGLSLGNQLKRLSEIEEDSK